MGKGHCWASRPFGYPKTKSRPRPRTVGSETPRFRWPGTRRHRSGRSQRDRRSRRRLRPQARVGRGSGCSSRPFGYPKTKSRPRAVGSETPRSVGQGHVDTVLGEADDISRAVAVYVRHKARVFVLAAPAARFGTPKRSPDRGLLGLKPPVSVALGHVDTVLGEADDFGQVEAVSVRKQARVGVLAAPAARLGTPKRSPTRELLGLKPPGSVGQGHVDTVSGEADDVSRAVVVYVRKLAWVGVLAVPAAAGTKGVENRSRRPQN